MTAALRFLREFARCLGAVFAFAAGYKLGERYALGRWLARCARRVDLEAWQAGYDLSTKRYEFYRR